MLTKVLTFTTSCVQKKYPAQLQTSDGGGGGGGDVQCRWL